MFGTARPVLVAKTAPGRDGPAYGMRKDPYDVLLVAKDGSATTYQHY